MGTAKTISIVPRNITRNIIKRVARDGKNIGTMISSRQLARMDIVIRYTSELDPL